MGDVFLYIAKFGYFPLSKLDDLSETVGPIFLNNQRVYSWNIFIPLSPY